MQAVKFLLDTREQLNVIKSDGAENDNSMGIEQQKVDPIQVSQFFNSYLSINYHS